jgi:hypothetical protein
MLSKGEFCEPNNLSPFDQREHHIRIESPMSFSGKDLGLTASKAFCVIILCNNQYPEDYQHIGKRQCRRGGSVKAVRTTGFRRCVAIGEHVASVGGAYGCGEGGERRAVRCECFSLLILPTLLSGRFSTLRSFFRLSYSKPVWAKNLVCFPNVDFRSAWICIRMDFFRFPFFRCFTKNSGSF